VCELSGDAFSTSFNVSEMIAKSATSHFDRVFEEASGVSLFGAVQREMSVTVPHQCRKSTSNIH
jgi:hypothetical protein